MAGHSKWANIKFRKAAQDKKRGKIFTKLIREITIAARQGGGDASTNPRLRLAIDKALAQNMTRDTVDRAIKRGAGGLDGAEMMECTYEGYGIAGVAVIVQCMTDNKNRTVAEVRHAFSKAGGNLGTDGSVAYLFAKEGQMVFPSETDENKVMEIALEVGADDVTVNDDGSIEVTTSAHDFEAIKEAMERASLKPEHAEMAMNASIKVPITDKETAEKLMRMIDNLEDLDDVQEVYTNADISEAILAEL